MVTGVRMRTKLSRGCAVLVMRTPVFAVLWRSALAGAGVLLAVSVGADPLEESVTLTEANNREEQRTQQRIDRLSEETRAMLEEYHALSREQDSLALYNEQLQRLTASQEGEKQSLLQQIEDIELTQREIVPLMLRMIDGLEAFIQDDTPFLLQERQRRVGQLRALMDRSDVSVAEKYRRVLEAYQTELDYGRTLEVYRDELTLEGERRTVELLRLGRVGWYSQTLDGKQAAYWDSRTGSWSPVGAAQRIELRRAFRVGSQQTAPELLELPVSVREGRDLE